MDRVAPFFLTHSVVVGVSQTAALNRGRHLYSAGRPSRWLGIGPHSSLLYKLGINPQNVQVPHDGQVTVVWSSTPNMIVEHFIDRPCFIRRSDAGRSVS